MYTHVNFRKTEVLFNKTIFSLKGNLDVVLTLTVCLDDVVLIHVDHYVHADGLQQSPWYFVGLLVYLALNDVHVAGIQIRRTRGSHMLDCENSQSFLAHESRVSLVECIQPTSCLTTASSTDV